MVKSISHEIFTDLLKLKHENMHFRLSKMFWFVQDIDKMVIWENGIVIEMNRKESNIYTHWCMMLYHKGLTCLHSKIEMKKKKTENTYYEVHERTLRRQHIYIQQVMLLGDSGVGKTCLLVRFRDGTFLSGSFISTVGIDFRVRKKDILCWRCCDCCCCSRSRISFFFAVAFMCTFMNDVSFLQLPPTLPFFAAIII